MAITTTNEKFSTLAFKNWLIAAVPISSDGLGLDEKKQLLHEYPTQTFDPTPEDDGKPQWLTRYRRRKNR